MASLPIEQSLSNLDLKLLTDLADTTQTSKLFHIAIALNSYCIICCCFTDMANELSVVSLGRPTILREK